MKKLIFILSLGLGFSGLAYGYEDYVACPSTGLGYGGQPYSGKIMPKSVCLAALGLRDEIAPFGPFVHVISRNDLNLDLANVYATFAALEEKFKTFAQSEGPIVAQSVAELLKNDPALKERDEKISSLEERVTKLESLLKSQKSK